MPTELESDNLELLQKLLENKAQVLTQRKRLLDLVDESSRIILAIKEYPEQFPHPNYVTKLKQIKKEGNYSGVL